MEGKVSSKASKYLSFRNLFHDFSYKEVYTKHVFLMTLMTVHFFGYLRLVMMLLIFRFVRLLPVSKVGWI